MLRSMMDRLFVLVATLGVVTIAVDTLRVALTGYNASYATDLLTFGVVFGVLALRKRLPIRVVFGVVVGAMALMGVASLAALGLASAGMMILTATCILVGVFAGLRTAVITAIGVFLIVALTAWSVPCGVGQVPSNTDSGGGPSAASPPTLPTVPTALARPSSPRPRRGPPRRAHFSPMFSPSCLPPPASGGGSRARLRTLASVASSWSGSRNNCVRASSATACWPRT